MAWYKDFYPLQNYRDIFTMKMMNFFVLFSFGNSVFWGFFSVEEFDNLKSEWNTSQQLNQYAQSSEIIMINEYNHLDGTWRRFLFQNFCILVKRIERVKLKRKVILFTHSFNQIAEFNIILYMSVLYFCVFACIWSPFYGNPQRKACKTQKILYKVF